MENSSTNKIKKWSTVLGGFLVLFPNGTPWMWGNISVYAKSYVLHHIPSTGDLESPWTVSLLIAGISLGFFAAGFGCKFLGKRLSGTIGIVFTVACYFVTYYTVQKSLFATYLMFGLFLSTTIHMLEGTAILYVVEWFGKDVGFASGIVQSGYQVGGIVMNQIVTHYINPRNLSPDIQRGHSKYFSQIEVLEKVPSVFLLMGGIAFIFCVVGFLLIRQNPRAEIKKGDNSTNYPLEAQNELQLKGNAPSYSTITNDNGGQVPSGSPNHPEKNKFETTSSSSSSPSSPSNMSPMQACRSPRMFLLCCLFLVAEFSFMLVTNYYKSYGQIYIHDDHFLTNMSIGILVIPAICRTLWGLLVDKQGLRFTLIMYYSSCCILCFCFYFSPLINRWCYALVVIAMASAACPLMVLFAYAALKDFGEQYFQFNLSLLMSPSILANLLLPLIWKSLMVTFGWFSIFLFCSSCSLLALVAVLLFIPKDV